jgi:DHA1 family tetracycline resistance protein-like MFS transporter
MKDSRRTQMAFLLVTVFVDTLGFGLILPLLPSFFPEAGRQGIAAGSAVSLFSALQFIGLPVLGVLSDRLGRKPVLLAGLLGSCAGYVLLAVSRTPGLVYAGIAVGGLASGTIFTAQAAIADTSVEPARTRLLGVLSLGYGAGVTIGPLMGAVLARAGTHTPPAIAAVLALANAAFGAFTFSESLLPSRRSARTLSARDLLPGAALARTVRQVSLRAVYASVFLVNMSLITVLATVPVYAGSRFSWSGSETGVLFGFLGVCAVATQVVILPFAQRRLGERVFLPAGLAAAAVAVAVVPPLRAGWALFPCLCVYAVCIGVAIPTLTGRVSRGAPPGGSGSAIAGMNAVISVSFIVTPFCAGFLSSFLHAGAPWLLAGSAAIAAAAVILFSWRDTGQ